MKPEMLQKIMKRVSGLRKEFDKVVQRGTLHGSMHGKCDVCRGHTDIFVYDLPPDLVDEKRVAVCRGCMKKATGNDGGLGI